MNPLQTLPYTKALGTALPFNIDSAKALNIERKRSSRRFHFFLTSNFNYCLKAVVVLLFNIECTRHSRNIQTDVILILT
jgi:hypothetical protein